MANRNYSSGSPMMMYLIIAIMLAIGGFAGFHFWYKDRTMSSSKCYFKSGDGRKDCFKDEKKA